MHVLNVIITPKNVQWIGHNLLGLALCYQVSHLTLLNEMSALCLLLLSLNFHQQLCLSNSKGLFPNGRNLYTQNLSPYVSSKNVLARGWVNGSAVKGTFAENLGLVPSIHTGQHHHLEPKLQGICCLLLAFTDATHAWNP